MSIILYFNGPSSSGKTTLIKALQQAFEEPFLHLGMDKIIGFMPAKLNNWKGGKAPLGFSWTPEKDPTGKISYHMNKGPFAKKLLQTLKDVTLLFAFQKYHLIIEDVAFGQPEVNEWKKTLKNQRAFFIGIKAPLQALENREKARGNRYLGTSRSQYFRVHKDVQYDLELDTHLNSLEENVEIIKKHLGIKLIKK